MTSPATGRLVSVPRANANIRQDPQAEALQAESRNRISVGKRQDFKTLVLTQRLKDISYKGGNRNGQ